MSTAFFNLVTNAEFSLVCGFLVVSFFLWLFRIETGPLKLFFLSLPFVKVVSDFVRGLPSDSVTLVGLDPFALPPRHQLLTVDAGFDIWGPKFRILFGAQDLWGRVYSVSIGDYIAIWLKRTFNEQLLITLLLLIAAGSACLIYRRIKAVTKFERQRRKDEAVSVHLKPRALGRREVKVYISQGLSGTPFTGGVRSPYICIPENARDALSPEELEAVISHEMAHIRQFDLIGTVCVRVLGDLFWFVPGYRWLSRKLDHMRELVADQWAVRSGTDAALLAYALIKLREIPDSFGETTLYSAFFREKSLLKARVENLIGQTNAKRARLGWQYRWARVVVSFWIVTAVLFATLGGNVRSETINRFDWQSDWIQNWMKTFGLS